MKTSGVKLSVMDLNVRRVSPRSMDGAFIKTEIIAWVAHALWITFS